MASEDRNTGTSRVVSCPSEIQKGAREQAQDFLRHETQFHLGYLPTEQAHPRTRRLSEALQAGTAGGIRLLQGVDDDIPPLVRQVFASPSFAALVQAIGAALDGGRRIYFSGCGATGRLAILLDAANRRFWRESAERLPELQAVCRDLADRTHAVMTGGDFALVRSVEMFEDYRAFGCHQMQQAGVAEGDVVVAISEGGETSSVLGTIQRGVDVGARVFFLFNNPAGLLAAKLERCRRVLENPAVTPLELCSGPMAVAGSTRMQAVTVELLVAGTAFELGLAAHLRKRLPPAPLAALALDPLSTDQTLERFQTLLEQLRSAETVAALANLVGTEERLYARGGRMTYFADAYMLDIFTDTTERSPTFKIPPFRSCDDSVSPAPWTFVKDPLRPTPDAWRQVLEHEPRCLDWDAETYRQLDAPERLRLHPPALGRDALHAFRIGREPDPSRTEVSPNTALVIAVGTEAARLDAGTPSGWRDAFLSAVAAFETRGALVLGRRRPAGWDSLCFQVPVDLPETPLNLFSHLAVKLVLNTVSTATMGRLGRLDGNWMTHVDASNKKLIDRSIRLVSELGGVDYEAACVALFETLEDMRGWDEGRRKTVSPAAHTLEKLKKGRNEHD